MIKEIGRNDPCPCGSGMKYKKCCLKDLTNRRFFDEKDIVDEINKISNDFKTYWESKRPKIKRGIFWELKRDMPKQFECRDGTFENGDHIIMLNNIPPTKIKPSKIAHEIEHIVLVEEGYPLALPIVKEDFSSLVNSLLQDPLIYKRLSNFGFNVAEDFKENVDSFLKECGYPDKPRELPLKDLEKFNWICNYVQIKLIMESVKVSIKIFDDFFNKNYNEIVEKGKELINKVHEIGFQTKNEQTEIMNYIVQNYKLNGHLILKHFN